MTNDHKWSDVVVNTFCFLLCTSSYVLWRKSDKQIWGTQALSELLAPFVSFSMIKGMFCFALNSSRLWWDITTKPTTHHTHPPQPPPPQPHPTPPPPPPLREMSPLLFSSLRCLRNQHVFNTRKNTTWKYHEGLSPSHYHFCDCVIELVSDSHLYLVKQ